MPIGAKQGHPASWAIWMCSAMLMALVTSNPLYHATIALCALVVYASVRSDRTRGLEVLLVAGLILSCLSILLNLVTGSTGPTEVFVLPGATLPGWLGSVTLGGRVTAESLVYAADQALALVALLCIICAFNASIDHFQLLKLTPPGLAQLGVVVSVGLLLVPETLARARTLREAHISRGRNVGFGTIPSSLLSLLSDGLERAVQRAESLDARGFGAMAAPPRRSETTFSIGGLVLAAVGAFSWYYAEDGRPLAATALLFGALLVISVAWRQASRGTARRLYVATWRRTDLFVVSAAIVGAVAFFALRVGGGNQIDYLPFPVVHAPGYGIAAAAACLLLLAPVITRNEP